MENFLVSVNVVLPLFYLMLMGFVLKKFKIFNDTFLEVCNKALFNIFLPILVFYSLYHSGIGEVVDFKFLIYGAVGITIYFAFLYVFCPKFIKNKQVSATVIQGSYRSNCLIFGIPIAMALYGTAGVGPTALIASVMLPLYNIFSVVVFSSKKTSIKKQFIEVISNPLIISVVLGLIFVLLNIKLPNSIESAVSSASQIGSPLALIVLGASFHFAIPRAKIAPIFAAVSLKVVIEPLIFLTIGYLLFGFTGTFFVGLMAAFATPASSTSYVVATAMGGDSDLSAQIVVFSSLVSIFTIFCVVFIGINLQIL